MDDELKKINIPEEKEQEVIDEPDEDKLIHKRYCDYIVDKHGTLVPFC